VVVFLQNVMGHMAQLRKLMGVSDDLHKVSRSWPTGFIQRLLQVTPVSTWQEQHQHKRMQGVTCSCGQDVAQQFDYWPGIQRACTAAL